LREKIRVSPLRDGTYGQRLRQAGFAVPYTSCRPDPSFLRHDEGHSAAHVTRKTAGTAMKEALTGT
jgi:hypothetical protein